MEKAEIKREYEEI